MAADGKALDRGDPRFFDCGAVHVVGQQFGPRHAAEEFVHEAEVAPEEPDERNLAAIEMGQIDAGAEQFFAAIFGMLDLAAAQHGDVGLGIEYGDVDRGLHGIEGGVVLGIEEALVLRRNDHGLAVPLDQNLAEIDAAVGGEFLQMLGRFPARQ